MHDLNSVPFADSPFVVKIDGANYVRSIQKVNPDGSLTFFCAIEEGLVLRVWPTVWAWRIIWIRHSMGSAMNWVNPSS